MTRLGLVGGISWVSTIEYYRNINEGINAELGGLQFADCLIHSINFGELQKRGWPQAEGLLLDSCRRLYAAGADAITLCANTAHLHVEAVRAAVNLPVIDIVEATMAEVIRQGHKTVGVLGTKFVMESDLYGHSFRKAGITALVPYHEVARNRIQYTIKEELGRGLVRDETKAREVVRIEREIDVESLCWKRDDPIRLRTCRRANRIRSRLAARGQHSCRQSARYFKRCVTKTGK